MTLGHGDKWGVIVRRGECTESRFRQPYPVPGKFREVGIDEARLKNDRAGVDPHAAWAVILE